MLWIMIIVSAICGFINSKFAVAHINYNNSYSIIICLIYILITSPIIGYVIGTVASSINNKD